MAGVSDWSATADENTSIDGINIAEHCPAKNINNAIRSVMASVKKNDASVVHTAAAETITGTKTFTETIAGTAAAAEKLATARTITLSGAASGSVAFDGSADATLEVSIGGNQGAVIGEVRWFAMSTPPEGWLVCNGAAVGTSDYAALFAAIGNTFLPEDVSASPTTFKLPNLMGKVPWGSTSVGTVLDAGAPDIQGEFILHAAENANIIMHTSGAMTIKQKHNSYRTPAQLTESSGATSGGSFTFRASSYNSIYGNSNTVQPPALCLLPCIRYE